MKKEIKNLINDAIAQRVLGSHDAISIISDRSGKKVLSVLLLEVDYIVKVFDLAYEPVQGRGPMIAPLELYEHEVRMLREVQQINDQYVDSYIYEENGVIIMNKVLGDPAHVYIRNHSGETERVVGQMIDCLKDLHAIHILHGDLQPAHFLVTKTNVELIDFGVAGLFPGGYDRYPGPLVHYASPEIAQQMMEKTEQLDYSSVSELYSLGSVLFYCLTGGLPTDYRSADMKSVSFDQKKAYIAKNGPDRYCGEVRDSLPGYARDILDKCLKKEISQRVKNVLDI